MSEYKKKSTDQVRQEAMSVGFRILYGGDRPINEEEKAGVKAIIFLQKMNGITETEEQALVGWLKMSESERENTMAAYSFFMGDQTKE